MALETFEIEATAAERGSVIWLHGLGATNHDFDPIIPELRAPHLRFIFPAAPLRRVTINQGMRMPAWYDILTFDDPPLREDEAHVREVSTEIVALIDRLRASRERTILLVEHKIDMVMTLSDTVAVLKDGRLIADDTPAAIAGNPEVQAAYFGGGSRR